jgi:hypothetical protein
MHSLRSIGYTTHAAIADLIDNSLGAGATRIDIDFAHTPHAFVSIIDNGMGMSRDELLRAMRYGSRDPREVRLGDDLGRFGLGLKTASLSQCRRLTVATLRDDELSIAVWDVDECERRRCWWLLTPQSSAISAELIEALRANGHGTAVIWENLDRLLGNSTANTRRALDDTMAAAADHLALTFHRFLNGSLGRRVSITMNGLPLPTLDPFLEGHQRGQALHAEQFPIDGHIVSVAPFVLPYPSKLKAADLEKSGGRERLKVGHGFYIYRGGRLVVPGGWFRIVPADDLVRLARIRVDVPVELDHIWKVDVRKATAEPPPALRDHLKRIVGQAATRSRRVYTHRGSPVRDTSHVAIWQRHDLRDGLAAWKLNREHPLVAAACKEGASAATVRTLLDMAERLLPIHDIHIHLTNDLPVDEIGELDDLEDLAEQFLHAFDEDEETRSRLLATLHLIEPFSREPEHARQIAERLNR